MQSTTLGTSLNQVMLRTRLTAKWPEDRALDYLMIALPGEVGELCNIYKKIIRDNPPPEKREAMMNQMRDELGDVLFYVAAIADVLGPDLEGINALNAEKLATRHGLTNLPASYDLPR